MTSLKSFHSVLMIILVFQVFAYDYCFWSMDEADKEKFAGKSVSKDSEKYSCCQ